MRPIVTSARSALRTERGNMVGSTGLLAKSLGVKTKIYKRGRNAGTVWVGVGPRTGFKRIVQREVKDRKGRRHIYLERADPVRYAHLVEFGGAHRHGGTRKAVPFMRKAWVRNKNTVGASIIRKLPRQVERIVLKEAKKAKVRR